MGLPVPLVGYSAGKWLPEPPVPGLRVLALQGAAIAAAFGSVYFMEHA